MTVGEDDRVKMEEIPKCPSCGSVARPVVLMFGDYECLPNRERVHDANFESWQEETKEKSRKMVVIEIGAGVAIPTVRDQSEEISRKMGASVIRINPEHPNVPPESVSPSVPHVSIPLGALEALDLIWEFLEKPPHGSTEKN